MKATLEAFRHPVAPETRQRLAAAWARVPARLRTPRQFLGRQYAGCGATIGAMPRCDFACRGCYLGQDANRVPPASLDVVKRQLARLRDWLGEGGNVQLTDGEVTLRPEAQLIELIRHARALGLVPMVMTHGDTFRRRPGLLERLMIEGGLTELSVHIDTTQRGRRDYREARREDDLAPLREEFGALIRQARRRTGRRLEVATTVTVSRENLDGVADIVRWLVANAGAFKMVSFQPVAAVGRTEAGLREVTATELWERIAEGLYGERGAAARLAAHEGWLGHPACSRFVQGVVVHQPGTPPAFHALFHPDELRDRALLDAWLGRFGGLTLRLDGSGRALARLTGARAGPRVAVPARLAPALGPRPSVAARGALAPRPRASGLPQHRESPLHESSGARHAPRPGAARALRVQGARRRRARVHVRAQRSRRARSLLRTAARGDPRRPGGETPCSRLS